MRPATCTFYKAQQRNPDSALVETHIYFSIKKTNTSQDWQTGRDTGTPQDLIPHTLTISLTIVTIALPS